MIVSRKKKLMDLITTIFIFTAGIYGFVQALGFDGRAGMWPTIVMVFLILSVGLHLFNLLRQFIGAESMKPPGPAQKSED